MVNHGLTIGQGEIGHARRVTEGHVVAGRLRVWLEMPL
jgi:hypothetical protein